jgi:dihydroflavonol-4-reductase
MILVTGATGHIGNVLVRALVARGEQVRALLWRGEDDAPLQGVAVDIVRGDVLDLASLGPALRGVDRVFHLAGMISIMPGRNEMVHRVNVEGTLNVMLASLQAGVRRMIYTSSIHAIQRVPHGAVVDETIPFDPNNPVGAYDRSKAEASLRVLAAVNQGMDAVIVCPTGVVGPYDFRRSEIGEIVLGCVKAKPQFYVDGAYDFVDVRDVATGMILAAEHGCCGETYILSGEHLSVRHLVDTLWELTGRKFPRIKIPFGLAHLAARVMPAYYRLARVKPRFTPYSLETLRSNANISHAKAAAALGYQARPLRDSLADMVAWYQQCVVAPQPVPVMG